jgi:hypothetical protein
MSLTAPERETIITLNDEDGQAEIWTAQRPRITALKKNPAATLLEEGKYGSSAWATFRLPAELVSFRSKRVRRDLTDQQREQLADRARAMREKHAA